MTREELTEKILAHKMLKGFKWAEVAEKIGIDPIDLRLKNAAKSNSPSSYRPQFREIGYIETL